MNYNHLIQAYLKGEADARQKEMLNAWICASDSNYSTFLRIKNIWEAEHPAFNPDDVENIKEKEKRSLLGARRHGRKTFLRYWSSASAILLVPLCILTVYLASRRDGHETEMLQKVACAYGAVSNFMLPDGSVVYLNSGSTISFPSSFGDKERVVNLRGEAYFEVLSDKEHPFTVCTDDMSVTATGTKFNVEAYPGFTSRITLVNGVLDINKGIHHYSLPQGHQLQCDGDGAVSSFRTETFKWTSWKDGILAFRGDKLSYVFERLSLVYNATIIIDDPQLAEFQIRATFTDERLDEIMSLLEKCAPIRHEKRTSKFAGETETEYHLFLVNN